MRFHKNKNRACFFEKSMIIYFLRLKTIAHASVAQLDRVSDYESEGREFESLPARHRKRGCEKTPQKTDRHITESIDGYVPVVV